MTERARRRPGGSWPRAQSDADRSAAALVLLLAAALIAANVHWHLLPSLQIETSQSWENDHMTRSAAGGSVLRLEYKHGLVVSFTVLPA